jgi:hypothetical protein
MKDLLRTANLRRGSYIIPEAAGLLVIGLLVYGLLVYWFISMAQYISGCSPTLPPTNQQTNKPITNKLINHKTCGFLRVSNCEKF